MTGLEFLAAGLTFEIAKGGVLTPLGPADRPDLARRLRFEVASRIALVGDEQTFAKRARTPWGCDVCGDQIGHGRDGSCPLCGLLTAEGRSRCSFAYGGTCLLCTLARQAALRARREREGRAA